MLSRILEPEVMDTLEASMAYEEMDHSAPNAAVVWRLREFGAGGRMLDLGTGPGHIPLGICEQFPDATVIGVDRSHEMLKLARKRLVASPFADRVQFQIADVKSLPFASHSFDVVFSNTTLHHLPDPIPFLAEAWRVLRPGGVLLIRDLYRPATLGRRDELVRLHAAQNTPLQRQLLADSLHAALTPRELLAAAYEAGMTCMEVTVDSDRHMTLQTSRR